MLEITTYEGTGEIIERLDGIRFRPRPACSNSELPRDRQANGQRFERMQDVVHHAVLTDRSGRGRRAVCREAHANSESDFSSEP